VFKNSSGLANKKIPLRLAGFHFFNPKPLRAAIYNKI